MKRRTVLMAAPLLPALGSTALGKRSPVRDLLKLTATAAAPTKENFMMITVRLTNASAERVVIPDVNSQRGWEAFRFEFIDSTGARLWVVRAPRDWTGPSGRTLGLPPKGHHEFQLTTDDRWWMWPLHMGGGEAGKFRVHFDQPKNADRLYSDLWTGHLESDLIELPAPLSRYYPYFVQ